MGWGLKSPKSLIIKDNGKGGTETFILSGYPQLEEAFRVAELLFARLPLTHDETHGSDRESPFFPGEIVGNDLLAKSPVASSSGKC